MKSLFRTLILTLALMTGAAASHAVTNVPVIVTSPHHQLMITGLLRSATTNGSVTTLVTVPVNNATLLAGVAALTGSSAQSLDIVMNDQTAEIDVITKTTNPTVVYTLGYADQNTNTDAELHATSGGAKSNGIEVITQYEIALPNLPGPVPISLLLKVGSNTAYPDEFARVLTDFFGGFDEGQPDSYILQGTAITTLKVYNY